MSKPLIVLGDKTGHGVVVTGAPASDVDGKPIARVGNPLPRPTGGVTPTPWPVGSAAPVSNATGSRSTCIAYAHGEADAAAPIGVCGRVAARNRSPAGSNASKGPDIGAGMRAPPVPIVDGASERHGHHASQGH